jgi:hypothetical protein
MLEFLQEQVDDILDEEFPNGLPQSRVNEAARKRQVRLIRKEADTPQEAAAS